MLRPRKYNVAGQSSGWMDHSETAEEVELPVSHSGKVPLREMK
jgi:hypothetical protein